MNTLIKGREAKVGKDEEVEFWEGEEIEVEDLIERLEPFVSKSNDL